MTAPFTLAELDAAADVVHAVFPATPAIEWPLLSEAVGVPTVLKHENHTPVGAFKVRGGLVYADRLRRERPQVTTLVSATRGNHGQSLALAGRTAGLRVIIVVPFGNSADKNAAMRALGAEVLEHGHDFQEAREHAATLADDPERELVPSFHPDLVLGVATYARELFAQAAAADPRPLDTVYVAIGMGSGCCGLLAVRDLLGLPTEIVGVVSERADATARSVAAGRVVNTDTADTFVDGVATRSPDEQAIRAIGAGVARIVMVSEDAAAQAMRLVYRTTHNVAEPAGALAVAGLTADAARGVRVGGRVGAILSGGNVDADVLVDVLSGHTPAPPSRRHAAAVRGS